VEGEVFGDFSLVLSFKNWWNYLFYYVLPRRDLMSPPPNFLFQDPNDLMHLCRTGSKYIFILADKLKTWVGENFASFHLSSVLRLFEGIWIGHCLSHQI